MVKLTRDEQKALDLHNKVRAEAKGGSRPALTWCPKLQKDAAAYAAVLGKLGRMQHDTKAIDELGFGENIFYKGHGNGHDICADPLTLGTKFWADEVEYYKGEKLPAKPKVPPGQKGQTGHYTEMVWPEVLKVGIAKFVCTEGDKRYPLTCTFVVARYDSCQITGYSAWRAPDPILRSKYDRMIKARGDMVGDAHLTREGRKKDEKNTLKAINKARKEAKGSRSSVVWSPTLADKAFKWSEKLAKLGKLEYDMQVFEDGQGLAVVHHGDSKMANPLAASIDAWLACGKGYRGEVLTQETCTKYRNYLTFIWPEATKVGLWAFRAEGSKYKLPGTFVVAYVDKGIEEGKSAWSDAKGDENASTIAKSGSKTAGVPKGGTQPKSTHVPKDGSGTTVDLEKWGKNLPDSIKNIGKTGFKSPVVKDHKDWYGQPGKGPGQGFIG